MISRSSTVASSTRRTMSTATTSTPTPTFPAPIPVTYSWSTPNALRRLSLPPLSTAPPVTRSQPVGRSQGERVRPRGGRLLPRQGLTTADYKTQAHIAASYRPERIIHNPYYNTNIAATPPLGGTRPPTIPLPATPSPSELAYLTLEPWVPVWTGNVQDRGRGQGGKALAPANKEKSKERRLSISGIVAILRRTRSRSRSGTREAKRNLLDDE